MLKKLLSLMFSFMFLVSSIWLQNLIGNVFADSSPTISWNPPTSWTEWEFYTFTPIVDDADWDVLTFTWKGIPHWANLDLNTWTLKW